eukprot:366093-Chlamydomonas_euryale.AAC.2
MGACTGLTPASRVGRVVSRRWGRAIEVLVLADLSAYACTQRRVHAHAHRLLREWQPLPTPCPC